MTWAELSGKLRTYILVVSGLASLIALWAIRDMLTAPPQMHGEWLALAVLALLVFPCSLLLPSVNTAVGIGDAYIMAIGMMYGVAPCIIVTSCQTLLISLFAKRPQKHPYKIVFNLASTICCAWLYSSIYHLINPSSIQLKDIIVPSAILAVCFFLINSILSSIAIAWSLGESIPQFWAKTCIPLALDYSLSAVCATSIVALRSINFSFPILFAPLIGVIWLWHKLTQARVIQAEKHIKEQDDLYLRTVESLALAVDAKDQTTYGHIRRVKTYAMGLTKFCQIKDQNELKAIETGALLHDIGKLAIDDYILNKPGRLSNKEFEKIKIHANAGDEILQQVCFPFPVAKYVRNHHERWDGLGYPDGLKGEDIPLGARILTIADAYDAIRFSRPYKLSLPTEEALEILKTQSGIVFDPKLVQLFTEHIEELEQDAIRESENAPQLSYRKYFEEIEKTMPAQNGGIVNPNDVPNEIIKLAEFCSSIFGHLELGDIFPTFARRIGRIVPFGACAFYLDAGDNSIRASFAYGHAADFIQGHSMPIGKGISGWVAAHGSAIVNTTPALDFHDLPHDFSMFSDVLAVPIIHENEVLGTITMYASESQTYKQQDQHFLEIVAGLLAPLVYESKKSGSAAPEDELDPTTRLRRISYLAAVAPQLIASAHETHSPLSLIYIELKNLSQITRVYGSHMGNSILKKMAEYIKKELRGTDILVRYGIQGFVAFLPGVRDEHANGCAQRLKQEIKNEPLPAGQGFSIDCQSGIASLPKDGTTLFSLLQSAQQNMQSAVPKKSESQDNVINFSQRP
jgi:diguanylate cyclase (GGDEF)-like protein/putative nucleotidyltransferase with HDIG domain